MSSDRPSTSFLGRGLDVIWDRLPRESLGRIARRRGIAISLLGVGTFLAAAGVGIFAIGDHLPMIHDEFAYLLQAETFAAGRLTNPVPPAWEHFETFHVLMRPTYMGKYPPAQGLSLVVGVLAGYPILAVWISAGAMVAAITWMLFGFVPPKWAVMGGFLAALQWGIVGYWSQSFWGGTMAAIGGALVLGTISRAFERPSIREGILLGLGVAILANSRPYEGLLLCVVAAIALVARWRTEMTPSRIRFLASTVGVVLVAALLTGYYNERVVGDATRFPHQEYREQYALTPVFIWHGLNEDIEYRHETIARFWGSWQLAQYRKMTDPVGFLRESSNRIMMILIFFLGPGVVLLAFLPLMLRDSRMVLVLSGILVILVGTMVTLWSYPHYVAPATPLFAAFVTGGLARAATHRSRYIVGRRWVVLVLFAFLVSFTQRVLNAKPTSMGDFPENRARIQQALEEQPGKDIVFVRYAPSHNVHAGWVYNSPDLDSASVIWARDMGDDSNHELMALYPARRVWLVEVGPGGPRMSPLRRLAYQLRPNKH